MKQLYTFLFLILLFSIKLNGQGTIGLIKSLEENKFLSNEKIEGRHYILMQGSGLVSSSSIQSSMSKPIVFGGNISEEAKQNTYNYIANSNTAGIQFQSEIITAHRTDELFGKGSMIFLGIGYRNINETRFSGDVFKLMFSGNSILVDKEIDLKNQSFESYSYSDFRIGFAKNLKKEASKKNQTIGFSFGYIKSFSHFGVNTHSGMFYTSPESYNMMLDADYTMVRSDTCNNSIFAGKGAYMSLYYGFEIEDKFYCKFSLEDIGLIFWEKGLKSEKIISHTFTGIQINDITKIEESTDNLDQLTDSLRNSIIYPNTIQNYTTILPLSVNINMHYQVIKQIGVEAFIRIFPYSLRKFEFMGLIHVYPLKDHLRISPFIYNSGYGKWHPGLELSVYNLKKIYIKAGTYSLEFNKSTYGGYASLGFKL